MNRSSVADSAAASRKPKIAEVEDDDAVAGVFPAPVADGLETKSAVESSAVKMNLIGLPGGKLVRVAQAAGPWR